MTDVRAATAADLDEVLALDHELFGVNAWSRSAMTAELAANDGTRMALVAVDGDEVVGYAMLLMLVETADLQRIAVAAGHQRAGLGSRLLRVLIDAATGNGCSALMLELAADDDVAATLYRRHGFAEIGRRPRYYPDGNDALVMRRELKP